MRSPKLSVNTLLLVLLIFGGFTFFITLFIVRMADRSGVNTFNPVEGTDYAIRYSSLEPNGLYQGNEVVNSLVVKGNFGFDWGAALEGERLYLNEYNTSNMGVMHSDLVRVDLTTKRKETLFTDAILRGKCASGELVCVRGVFLPANEPESNVLCKFYALTAPGLHDGAEVLFLDPATGEIVYSVRDDGAMTEAFEARYLQRTLEEVRQ